MTLFHLYLKQSFDTLLLKRSTPLINTTFTQHDTTFAIYYKIKDALFLVVLFNWLQLIYG